MNEKTGTVFSIAKENQPAAGCTISKEVHRGNNSIFYFSLAENTDISAEIFPYHKLILVQDGTLTVYGRHEREEWEAVLNAGEFILTETDAAVGMKTDTGAVYAETEIRKEDSMNSVIKAGEVFKLAELVPYQDGKIVNMDIVHNRTMKFVVMAFSEGTGLSEHAAPGEALVFALDGDGIIGYEGKEYPIHAGENFHFAKGGMHSVTAKGKFKMALLLTLE
ncbi:MAG: cupin domain-containing protein [Eubacteriales bacterium]|nr:cupin domain-containing protein [Eubacteriales bacterium]